MNRKFGDGYLKLGILLGSFLGMRSASAASPAPSGGLVLSNPLGGGDFITVLNNIINFMIYIAIPLATIMVLVGAFKLVTSSGDPEKTKSGRNTILYAAAGFAVVLLAKGVTGFIQALLAP